MACVEGKKKEFSASSETFGKRQVFCLNRHLMKFASVRFAEQEIDRLTSNLQGNQHQIMTMV
jgi:hypothetical protein